jgi:hypothetical protein
MTLTEKKLPKIWVTSVILHTLPIVSNCLLGENSPNLAPLIKAHTKEKVLKIGTWTKTARPAFV